MEYEFQVFILLNDCEGNKEDSIGPSAARDNAEHENEYFPIYCLALK